MAKPKTACETVLIQVPGGRNWHSRALLLSDILNGRFPRSDAGSRKGINPNTGVSLLGIEASGSTNERHTSKETDAARSTPDRHRSGQTGWILNDQDVIQQIDQTARKFSRRYGHTSSDIEDIRQDIRLHLFQKESLYDPVRGTPGAFANTVLRSWLWTSVRYLKQQRRKGRMYTWSFSRVEIPPEMDGIDQTSARVESADLLATCLSRLSEDEIWLLRLILEHGQERAAALSEIPRRQLRHRLCFICTTCSDLHSFSEKAAKP